MTSTRKKIIFSHPTGNANVRAAAKGLLNTELLHEFYTTIATFPGSKLDMISSFPPLAELRRRTFDSELQQKTRTWPWIEMGRLIASKAGIHSLIRNEKALLSIDEVYKNLDKRVASKISSIAKGQIDAIYGYEDGSYYSFKQAKKKGLKCLYDLPIGYWRAARHILQKEHGRWPDWISTLPGLSDSEEKLARKDEELRLADHIFVASSFTAKTLRDFPGTLATVQVIPYGFPPVNQINNTHSSIANRRLKILFVGGLSQRKGIADLFAAVEKLSTHAELTVVGRKSTENCKALDAGLKKHKWIPSLPHDQILDLMRQHDVFIFPSLFEGFGLVITEAMSQGTPVITTDRTAGPDIIKNGENGYVCRPDPEEIGSQIDMLFMNKKRCRELGEAGYTIANKISWDFVLERLLE